MIRTLQRGTGALFALLLAVLLSISLTGVATAAAPDHRDDYALGRFSDVSAWGDFSSPLTQALAALALHRADGVDPSEAAVELLLAQRCEDGGFPDAFRAPSTGDPAPCASSVDTTAFVVQALDAVGEHAAVETAVAWLAGVQEDDGSFGSADGLNANSTGLAALALDLGGETVAADNARDWVVAIQDTCEADTPGAIPFNAEERGAVELATSQAVLGLASVSLADLDASAASDDTPETGCDGADAIDDPAEAAVAYLVGELTDDHYLDTDFGPSVGGTIDVQFALAAVGVGATYLDEVTTWLRGQAAGYTQEIAEDGTEGAYAGASAKLALAMLIGGEDPTDVGGVDLIAQLQALETTELPEVTVTCDDTSSAPGGEVECTIVGLLAGETVDVRVEGDASVLDTTAVADGDGTAEISFVVPDDAAAGDALTVTVDGLGAEGLATTTLAVTAPEPEDEEDEAEEVVEEDDETTEEDEDILPETGERLAFAGGLALITLLLGGSLLHLGRRRQVSDQV